MADNVFGSELFRDQLRTVQVPGGVETVMYGGERNPAPIVEAFGDVAQVAIIGYKSQGPAHAQNLRESLAAAGSDTRVVVGLREGSETRAIAESDGFTVENGTLMTPEQAMKGAGVVTMLIEDSAMVQQGVRYMREMDRGTLLMLAHGIYQGHVDTNPEADFLDGLRVGMVAPKGLGPSVRRLYQQGSGINASFAVERGDDKTRDLVLAYSQGIGSPYTFQTTLGSEWRSDIFGERAILLGGVHGIVEALYSWKREHGRGSEEAYMEVVESLVGPISEAISHRGLEGLFESIEGDEDRQKFIEAYNAAYPTMKDLTLKVYEDVSSGREIAEVVNDNISGRPFTTVDGSSMWRAGERVRESMDEDTRSERVAIDPTVAGVYAAGMMAQVDVLRLKGHHWSEIVNESIIEAVDSLNPYMRKRGVAFMVDNCSITARRGGRKWAPQFQAVISQGALPVIDGQRAQGDDYFTAFLNHDVHQAFRVFAQMRPNVDISL
ncbi:ketol-acid reductoisomerase [Candidatus Saccharibacteria bacterium]|nr:ketol-acid reductoisomerase [Candidatus Saccharibacteria bacterium]